MKFQTARLLTLLFKGGVNLHSSQYGEDVYLHKKFRRPVPGGFYVDIGAHHPCRLSNTAYLWAMGWNGVNVDASQAAIDLFNRMRPQDLNLRGAVVGSEHARSNDTITFFYTDAVDNCATCDPAIAKERGLEKQETVPCLSLPDIIERACARHSGAFDLLNIDIEGLDEAVITDMERWAKKPRVLMIEIYGRTVRDMMAQRAFQIIEGNGYECVERIGHTAIFEWRDAA